MATMSPSTRFSSRFFNAFLESAGGAFKLIGTRSLAGPNLYSGGGDSFAHSSIIASFVRSSNSFCSALRSALRLLSSVL